MAFSLSDFKKTSRTSDAGRTLYPYTIKDDRYLSAISFAIDYYERMVGRRRAEIDPATLLEFFGDPKLARGLVACLGRSFIWRQRTIREVVGDERFIELRELGLITPSSLRAALHSYVNQHYNGFLLPQDRKLALSMLCHTLPITPDELEQLLILDADEEAVLTQVGPTPSAQEVVALYNFHSLETALRNTSSITLKLNGPVWSIVRSIHNLAQRYHLQYEVSERPRDLFSSEFTVTWHGRKDVLGGWSRHGRRLVRGVLRLLATHPDCPVEGEAKVHLQGRTFRLPLERKALAVLGSEARRQGRGDEVWMPKRDDLLASAWSRALSRGRTADWRLRRDPEPLVVGDQMLVPDFVLLRGGQQVHLFLPATVAAAAALAHSLKGATKPCVLSVPAEAAKACKGLEVPVVAYAEQPQVDEIVTALERRYPRPSQEQTLSRWERLELALAESGFVPDEELAALLGCAGPAEVQAALGGWADGTRACYLPGLGLCTPDRLGTLKKLLRDAA